MAREFEQSETGNWNVADKWSESMVFQPLFECSNYLKIADSGCIDLEEDLTFNEEQKTQFKIKGLEWARRSLEQGIKQSLFAIKSEADKKLVRQHLEDVHKLKEVIVDIKEKKAFQDKTKIVLNEKVFNYVYNVIDRIFTEITEPLNRSDLIFIHKETFDPHAFKKKAAERFIEGG